MLKMVSILGKLLSAKQVAIALGASVPSVWRWNSEGTIPASIKINGLTRWDSAELDAWLESKLAARTVAATPTNAVSAPAPRRNPVAPTTRPDAKRPGRPRKVPAAQGVAA